MEFTPIQQRIIELLSDGMPHDRSEVLKCIGDPLADYANLYPHISYLRTKLVQKGEWIVYEAYRGSLMYRHVKLIAPVRPCDTPI